MRLGLTHHSTGDYTPTTIQRVPQRLADEMRGLREHILYVENIAKVALALAGGLFAAVVLIIIVDLLRR